ncbi:twin-arginine translocase subunit TatC [Maridesulfovibrio ferrireducens]|uniref:twin-arginine translocase subunit TatC n=1 Tax=Maridesulfovibrio ferrireducens TaxID=246191 RepID=UPI001A2A8C71|nr:twin-arginine translocase subunit TatC [Maridesulfovibrio ferrireducens]MBI9111600.1 twin-arginine translocase subunit TatC [Maridesulfovibrio ferrireducens]
MSGNDKDSREVGQEEQEDSEKLDSSGDKSESESEGSTSAEKTGDEDGSTESVDSETGDLSDEEDDQDEGDEEPAMTFLQHMDELRRRFIRIFIACGVGFFACYAFAKPLFSLLMAPLVATLPENSTLIFTSLPEGFVTYLKVSFVAGFFLVSPYIFSQVWGFIAPGLYKHERKWMIPLAFLSAFFFVGGALFGYYVVFPFGCEFFMGFADEFIRPMPTLREYLSFSLKLLFAFGLIFEMPLFIFFLARLGVVTHTWLRAKRKYAILVCFICSAVLTPPDVITQTLMAGPLVILYEIGIWISYFFGKRGGRIEEKAKAKAAAEAENNDDDPDDSGPDGGGAASEESADTKEKDKKDSKKNNSDYDEDMIEM